LPAPANKEQEKIIKKNTSKKVVNDNNYFDLDKFNNINNHIGYLVRFEEFFIVSVVVLITIILCAVANFLYNLCRNTIHFNNSSQEIIKDDQVVNKKVKLVFNNLLLINIL